MAHSSQSKTQQSKKHLEIALADFDKANELLSQINMTNILDENDDMDKIPGRIPWNNGEMYPQRQNSWEEKPSLAYQRPNKNHEEVKSIL